MAIAFGKILTTSLTIGSGGSGGVFGPSMVIGGCGGGALGVMLHHMWPWLVPHPASFVIVGMAGFFAAAAKTPFSTLIIVSEMTGGYHLLLPSLWVCTLSFILSDKQSIYSSQVESRSLSPAHQGSYVREVLAQVRVSRFFVPTDGTLSLHPNDPLAKVVERLGTAPYSTLPVVDSDNRLLGVVTVDEVYIASQTPSMRPFILATDLMRGEIAAAHARGHARPGLGTVRRERSAHAARRRQSGRAAGDRHGEPLRYFQRLFAARSRAERERGSMNASAQSIDHR